MRKTRSAITVAGVSLLLAACGGDSAGPEESSFSATVSGDVSLSVSGEAVFGVSTAQGVDRWIIYLSDGPFLGSDFAAIAIGRERSADPIVVGTHTVEEAGDEALEANDISALFMLQRPDTSLSVLGSVSGTLTVSVASGEVVEGDFNFTAVLQYALTGGLEEVNEIAVTGSFVAIPGTVPSLGQ